MIAWLERAFGFTRHAVYPHPDGTIAHAELVLGQAMIMLGSGDDSPLKDHYRRPAQVGATTVCSYIIVTDPDALYARARAAGAEIVVEIQDRHYGGRDFTCRDPEGHLWSFGTYDPWTAVPPPSSTSAPQE
jgi:uncharacterized glyoxalase superfamily protein PhnB